MISLKSSLLLMKALKGEPAAKHGLTLRLTATDVDFGDEAMQVVLSYGGVKPPLVDLLVDFRAIEDAGALRTGMMAAAVTSLAEQPWRSISVAATSFPNTLTQYGEGQVRFPRHEWAAWLAVRGTVGSLDYSDYGIRNVPTPPGGAGTTPIPNLRNTLEDEWLVHRAKAIDSSLYETHSADLASSANNWMGADHCAGCRGIADCSTGVSGRTAKQAIRFGMVHHLTVVGQQLANLGAGASFA